MQRKALAVEEKGQLLLREKDKGISISCQTSAREWRKAKKTAEDLMGTNSPSLNVGWKLEEQS